MPERDHLSIGEVLALLRDEFPDVTISKIRFLESQGLVDPERTPSGYRKFYDQDVERLRWILLQQREKFLPLKVIKVKLSEQDDDTAEISRDQLDSDEAAEAADHTDGLVAPQSAEAMDSGQVPDPVLAQVRSGALADPGPPEHREIERATSTATPSLFAGIRRELDERAAVDPPVEADPPAGRSRRQSTPGSGTSGPGMPEEPARRDHARRNPAKRDPGRGDLAGGRPGDDGETYTVEELARGSGAPLALVEELRQYGLINPESTVAGTQYFDESALAVARAATALSAHGVEARHLRVWRNSADREADLYHQIVLPLLRQRNPQARSEVLDTLDELTRAGAMLREALLRRALREIK